MSDPICAVAVLNYNGRHLLEENLDSVLAAAGQVEGGCEVIVLDNQSKDDSLDFLRRKYPQVRIEVAPSNRILFSYNELLQRLRHKYVVILNNDIRLRPDTIALLLPHFAAPDIFAVCSTLMDAQGTEVTRDRVVGRLRRGVLYRYHSTAKEVLPALDAGGGCAAYDREKYLKVGGFDDLYWPFYWEDTDLSYVAWKRGYRILHEPRSIMYHLHHGTIAANDKNLAFGWRNEYLFFWKNITDPWFLLIHVAWLPVVFGWHALKGRKPYLRGLWGALRRMPQALKRRREMKPLWTRTDAEVLALSLGEQRPAGATAHADVAKQPVGAR